ncbi:LysR family transcriptional regulator [Nocardioides sp. ChNu-153]|uniref:LysR family transcriptional regulator n=1 Tax=Nocardioides sp. ChNu-153 TaxID=2779364 RepID=UPI0026562B23|nr:LysR family transcriptional regulator [Nocardioides sp. ChNu-153]MDN7120676.1 LysR family transcriptional regulator [Nocardioides sp. ChNu-153]
MIDLAALASLRAVDHHGSVVAAADALGYTPSAVSQQVKRLERQAGLDLLERVGRGVVLTRAGRQLVSDGAALLAELERIEADLHAGSGAVVGRLRVTAFSTAVRGLVAPAARALLDAHPGLVLALTEEEPWDTVDLVARGQVDVGVAHSWGDVPLAVPEHVATHEVGRDAADVVLPVDHPLAGRGSVTAAALVGEPWIATPPGTICREWLERMHDGTGARPRIAHQSREFDSHLALVAAGLGIALVPRLGRAALGPGLTTLEVSDPEPTRSVLALHRRTQGSSPAVAATLAALDAAWAAR